MAAACSTISGASKSSMYTCHQDASTGPCLLKEKGRSTSFLHFDSGGRPAPSGGGNRHSRRCMCWKSGTANIQPIEMTAEARKTRGSLRPNRSPRTALPTAMNACQHGGTRHTKKAPFWSSPDHKSSEPSGRCSAVQPVDAASIEASPTKGLRSELAGTMLRMSLVTLSAPGPGSPFFSTAKRPLSSGAPRTWKTSCGFSTVKMFSFTRWTARASQSASDPTLTLALGKGSGHSLSGLSATEGSSSQALISGPTKSRASSAAACSALGKPGASSARTQGRAFTAGSPL